MKRKLLTILVPLVSAVLLTIGLASPAFANQYTQTVNLNDQAMNRNGGGTADGTSIIAYHPNDPNDDSAFVLLDFYCNNGHVEAGCPFSSASGLDTVLEGDQIVMQWSPRTNKCVGTDSAGASAATLQECPSEDGGGGGWSTKQVLVPADSIGNQIYWVEVNVNWSSREYGGGGRCFGWSCALVVGAPNGFAQHLVMGTGDPEVRIGNPDAAQPYDQWSEFNFNCNC